MPKRKVTDAKEFMLIERTKKVKNFRHSFEEAAPEVKDAMLKDPKFIVSEYSEYSHFNTFKWAKEEFEQLKKYRSVNWGMFVSVREIELYERTSVPGGKARYKLLEYHCSERLNSDEKETDTSTEEREAPSSAT